MDIKIGQTTLGGLVPYFVILVILFFIIIFCIMAAIKTSKIKKILSALIIALAFAIVSPSAFSLPDSNIANAQAAVKLSKDLLQLTTGGTYRLKVTGTKQKVKWSSGSKYVATISSNGVIKTKRGGVCDIYATIGGKKYKCVLFSCPKNKGYTYGRYDSVCGKLKKVVHKFSKYNIADAAVLYLTKPITFLNSKGILEKVKEIQINGASPSYISTFYNRNIAVSGLFEEASSRYDFRKVVIVDPLINSSNIRTGS